MHKHLVAQLFWYFVVQDSIGITFCEKHPNDIFCLLTDQVMLRMKNFGLLAWFDMQNLLNLLIAVANVNVILLFKNLVK